MLLRFEFIGKQENETVFGHKFDTSEDNVKVWLEENNIHESIVDYAGLVPENFVLSFETVKEIFSIIKSYKVLHSINEFVYKEFYLEN